MTGPAAEPRRGSAPAELERRLDRYRGELTGYCYRMLGSAFDADDAVQETLMRAWLGLDRFEGRAELRSWLYRIATNVCFDLLRARQRRALPMDLTGASRPVVASLPDPLPASAWVEPIPDARVAPAVDDPAEVAVARESIRLAFVAALQLLPPRQRAVLVLRDVLRWKADEVADLLDTTVASVNSALQRARATLAAKGRAHRADRADRPTRGDRAHRSDSAGDGEKALLDRYVDAFQRYDMESLVALLHEDATQSMPPYPMWLRGRDDIVAWMLGPGVACRGSRVVPVAANGQLAVAQYRPSGPGGWHEPFSIHVVDVAGGRIVTLTQFLDTRLFGLFGLPAHPDEP